MDLETAKNIALIVSASVAAITLIITAISGILAFLQFRRSVALRRADQFAAMRTRREESGTINRLAALLETDSTELRDIPWEDKIDLLGFYEDVALMVNSGLIREHVAHYMFAYYALRCWESDNFWYDVNRYSSYWALFRDFVERMQKIEDSFDFRRNNYRL